MHWIWIWMSTSLPVVLAISILLESVQQHGIWTILYRSSLIGLVYSGVVFLGGIFILGYLQPKEQPQDQKSEQSAKPKAGVAGRRPPGSPAKAAVKS